MRYLALVLPRSIHQRATWGASCTLERCSCSHPAQTPAPPHHRLVRREDSEPPALVALANTLAQQLQGLPRHGVTTENVRMLLTCCTPTTLAATFRQLDSRNCGQRATDVFALLRRAPPSSLLASLCCVETYTAIISIVCFPPALPHLSTCMRSIATKLGGCGLRVITIPP